MLTLLSVLPKNTTWVHQPTLELSINHMNCNRIFRLYAAPIVLLSRYNRSKLGSMELLANERDTNQSSKILFGCFMLPWQPRPLALIRGKSGKVMGFKNGTWVFVENDLSCEMI